MQELRVRPPRTRRDTRVDAPLLAVVIPCYRVKHRVLDVIRGIGDEVALIFCVDDACPDRSGAHIQERCADPRVRVLFNRVNEGVGGAVIAGYRAALDAGARVVVKVDGDGQMDPRLIPRFVRPILRGDADYTKGNRFYNLADVRQMPAVRLAGNAVLSFLTKVSSGYWNVFDPTNGYTAVHAAVLRQIQLEKVSKRYFFESDLLYHLNLVRAVVLDVPMQSVYGDEVSNLRVGQVVGPFLAGNLRNIGKRLFYNYFLRDFTAASLALVFGLPLAVFGGAFGLAEWVRSATTGTPATAGTVMAAAFPVVTGLQLLLAAAGHDIASVPRTPVHRVLSEDDPVLQPAPGGANE